MRGENEPQGNSDWLQEFNLDLEDRVPCDSDKCENDAIYYTKTKCCGVVMLACRDCMTHAGRVVKMLFMRGEPVVCWGCQKKIVPNQWLDMPQKLALDSHE